MNARLGNKHLIRLIETVVLLLAIAAPMAQAAPNDPFTPQFGFSMSTTQAGANPDLTIEMRKQLRNRCVEARDSDLPIGLDNRCERQYIEQNVKRMTVRFPPGALPDPNAVPYCGLRQSSYPPPMDFDMPDVYFCENEDALVGVADVTAQFCELNLTPFGRPDGCESALMTEPFGCPDPQRPPQEGFTYWTPSQPNQWPGYTYQCRTLGYVYNEAPRLDDEGLPVEQGHLVVLLPRWPHPDRIPENDPDFWNNDPSFYERVGGYASNQVTHISVRVRSSDLGIDSISDVADWVPLVNPPRFPAQPSDIVLTLFGDRGAEGGHPLITNPALCDPQSVDAEFLGYAVNSGFVPGEYLRTYVPGFGDGKLVKASAPVRSTGCDKVPYDPRLTIDFDALGPDQAPAISSVVTQPDIGGMRQAANREVEVRFPKEFKVNAANTATHCSEEDLKVEEDARVDNPGEGCPESSRIGTAVAESDLLPIGQKLKGNVYLAGLTSDSIKISAFLKGQYEPEQPKFIDFSLRIDAQGKVGDDLVLKTTFADLPPVPVSRFELNLEGGDKGLIRTPKVCGPRTITADFKSRSGKVKRNTVPVEIRGCSDPQLDVELSNRRKGEPTDLDLSIGSKGTAIKAVELRMARQLHWGIKSRRRASGADGRARGAGGRARGVESQARGAKRSAKRLKSAGTIAFNTASGERKVRFKAKRTKRGNLGFAPLVRKTKKGQIIAAQVPGFSASLFRTARRQPRILTQKRRKGEKGRRARRRQQSDLVLTGLPGEDLTAVELSLRGKDKRRKFFLRNPTGCKKPLNFVAIVKTIDGRKLALKDQVRLKGKGCNRKKRSRR